MSDRNMYTIGCICAISAGLAATTAFLDKIHEEPEYILKGDSNHYTFGQFGKHHVVLAVLPKGDNGTASAAAVATNLRRSFPNVWVGLMIGIGGGAPSRKHDIRLGDVVVSDSVFGYDFGITTQDQPFRTTGSLNKPPLALGTAVSGLKAHYEMRGHEFQDAIKSAFTKNPRLRKKYQRPDQCSDKLYNSDIVHPDGVDMSCASHCGMDPSFFVARSPRTTDDDDPAIHYGRIASANQRMKDASIRDRLSKEEDVLCFEMQAAGLMNSFPCLIVQGICNYSDSHANKDWKGYAAMTAAAYAKDLILRIRERKNAENKIGDSNSGQFIAF